MDNNNMKRNSTLFVIREVQIEPVHIHLKKKRERGAWVAQSGKHLTLAQVKISWFVSSSPASGSVLTAQRLEPALDSLPPSLSALPQLVLSLCLSKLMEKKFFFLKKDNSK